MRMVYLVYQAITCQSKTYYIILVPKLERLYQFNALDYVLASIPNSISASLIGTIYERNNDYIVYKDIATVNQFPTSKRPISGIELYDQVQPDRMSLLYIIIKVTTHIEMSRVRLDSNVGCIFTKNQLTYQRQHCCDI